MSYKKRKVFNVLTAFVVVCVIFIHCIQTQAASSKMVGLNFGMKLNNTYTIGCWTPAGMKAKNIKLINNSRKTMTAKLFNQKISSKSGIVKFYDTYFSVGKYKKFDNEYYRVYANEVSVINKYYKNMLPKLEIITLKIKATRNWEPTFDEIETCSSQKFYFYNNSVFLTDYTSGKSLITADLKPTKEATAKGVYVLELRWSSQNTTTYHGNDGKWMWLAGEEYAYITIVKPKSYKGLCVGIAGDVQPSTSLVDRNFYRGKVDFKQTNYYKKAPTNSNWIRIK